MDSRLLADVTSAISYDRFSFYLWSVVFYELCLAVLILPLLLAIGTLGQSWARVLAVASVLSEGVALWSNLDRVAAGYGRAYSRLEGARTQFLKDQDETTLAAALKASGAARVRFGFRLPGAAPP